MTRELEAIQQLAAQGVDVKMADFHALSSADVDRLLVWADICKYRKPRNANGSRGRYFFARLQRIANGPKTELLHVVQGNYGHGWEDLAASVSRREALADLKAYRANESGPFRLIARRSPR